MITKDDVKKVVGSTFDDATIIKWTDLFNKNNIDTKLRLAHFLAQVKHESGNFRYTKELGNAVYFSKYEERADLGNTSKGDGVKYCGRGYIQVTGKANYSLFAKWSGLDVLNHPELLERKDNAMISAVWYWNVRKLYSFADNDDVKTITRKVNGGSNGLASRINYLREAKFALGLNIKTY